MTAPDYIFPLVGYRVWQWDEIGLKSLNTVRWRPGEVLSAECKTEGRHEAPQSDCTCGVYAAKSLDHLRRIGYTQDRIHGEVCLWGTVVEHEDEWRAQFAYPKNLIVPLSAVPFGMHGVELWLATFGAYGCDILVLGETGTVPLWCKDSGVDANGLDLLVQRWRAWYARRAEARRLKRGNRVAVLGHGIAVVESADSKQVQVVLGNKNILTIEREQVVWDEHNLRWETARGAGITLRHCR
ncbi:MAG TPA: hypothetical protein VE994_09790 [Terriglobales bacterium]|nr:hypothetical protein [Terriglobales bacterium]